MKLGEVPLEYQVAFANKQKERYLFGTFRVKRPSVHTASPDGNRKQRKLWAKYLGGKLKV
jgi:hypothetical protein